MFFRVFVRSLFACRGKARQMKRESQKGEDLKNKQKSQECSKGRRANSIAQIHIIQEKNKRDNRSRKKKVKEWGCIIFHCPFGHHRHLLPGLLKKEKEVKARTATFTSPVRLLPSQHD